MYVSALFFPPLLLVPEEGGHSTKIFTKKCVKQGWGIVVIWWRMEVPSASLLGLVLRHRIIMAEKRSLYYINHGSNFLNSLVFWSFFMTKSGMRWTTQPAVNIIRIYYQYPTILNILRIIYEYPSVLKDILRKSKEYPEKSSFQITPIIIIG